MLGKSFKILLSEPDSINARKMGCGKRVDEVKTYFNMFLWFRFHNLFGWLVIVMITACSCGLDTPPHEPPNPANRTFTLNTDGTFYTMASNSNVMQIKEGETVTFEGLARTDGIVRSKGSSTIKHTNNVEFCADLPLEYAESNYIPDANEFTGPLRKGVSGIFSLGQMANFDGSPSFVEVDMGTTDPNGDNGCTQGTPVSEVFDPHDGHYYQLCRDNPTSNDTLRVIFENPDIDGLTIRINWKDIEIGHDAQGNGIFDYTQLDSQMSQAAENGKVFILDFRAGIYGTPPHEYTDYSGEPGPGLVEPFTFHTVLGTDIDPLVNCGSAKKLASPAQAEYRAAYEDFVRNVIRHVRSNTAWWQAMARFKLSGVNSNTGEAKTAHLCDARCDLKFCTTRQWAEIETTHPGLGWRPEHLYQYYREIGFAIYQESLGQKSIGFQLIQDGFPRAYAADNINDPLNYYVKGGDDGHSGDDDLLPGGTEQTETVLQNGVMGDFTDPAQYNEDPEAGMAFVIQHSGLQTNPTDPYKNNNIKPACMYNKPIVTDPVSPFFGMAAFPLTEAWNWQDIDRAGSGCPNRWARSYGYQGYITGWQTTNTSVVSNPNEVSSALFNATTNSDGVFVELYEERLWEIMHMRGTGPNAYPVSGDKQATYFDHRKNLHAWSEEFHSRRKWIAENDVTNNPYKADPFPRSYSHTFDKDLAPGEVETYYFISPYKCAHGGSNSLARIGRIDVIGK